VSCFVVGQFSKRCRNRRKTQAALSEGGQALCGRRDRTSHDCRGRSLGQRRCGSRCAPRCGRGNHQLRRLTGTLHRRLVLLVLCASLPGFTGILWHAVGQVERERTGVPPTLAFSTATVACGAAEPTCQGWATLLPICGATASRITALSAAETTSGTRPWTRRWAIRSVPVTQTALR
jgi:hypothetical protein